ncbi:MAG: flagellar hook capping FlgD N-terminal domain-containing protein [Rhodoferax sp.]
MLNATQAPSFVENPAFASATTAAGGTSVDAMQDRFLKLLVAQLHNQDPMNPMDNAQMTSQMAQMSTVTGIEQVNATLKSMTEQFGTLQVMQGANLVGHNVLMPGNDLEVIDGSAVGAIDLAGSATSVMVDVIGPTGQVLETIDAGALPAGRHYFNWDATGYEGGTAPTFRIKAVNGDQGVAATPLMRDKVISVAMENGSLSIQLAAKGKVSYGDIKAIL